MRYGGKKGAKQRPEYFRLDATHQLARDLLFAGLGYMGSQKPTSYHDSVAELLGSSAANHGTLTNMDPATDWLWVPELGRWATDYDGSNDFVSLGNSTTLNPLSQISVSCFCLSSTIVGVRDILRRGLGSGAESYAIEMNASDVGFWIYSSGAWRGGYTQSFGTNEVTSIIGTFDGANIVTYKNGVAASPTVFSGTIGQTTDDTVIGQNGGSARYWLGWIADLMIWSRALSLSEISILADRSDPFLGGLILPPRRRLWGAVSAPTGKPTHMMHYKRLRAA